MKNWQNLPRILVNKKKIRKIPIRFETVLCNNMVLLQYLRTPEGGGVVSICCANRATMLGLVHTTALNPIFVLSRFYLD